MANRDKRNRSFEANREHFREFDGENHRKRDNHRRKFNKLKKKQEKEAEKMGNDSQNNENNP